MCSGRGQQPTEADEMGLKVPVAGMLPGGAQPVALGLRANLAQFSLFVLINAFVGGMVGLERAVLPLIAEHDFGLASSPWASTKDSVGR
jgi:hypothetical protein